MIIETDRLILRKFLDKDLTTFFAYRSDPSCQKYQCWTPLNYKQAKRKINLFHFTSIYSRKAQFAIALKDSDQNIGDIFFANNGVDITIGITIHPDYQKHGYATEILRAWITYLLVKFPFHGICALVHPENVASNALFKKLGFLLDGYDNGLEANVYSFIK